MMIPNKFNGYSRDGLRRYNDPVSAGLVASGTGALGGAATVATGLGALETGLTAGALLAGGGGGLLGELGLSAMGAPALGGLSGAVTPAIASEIAPAALAQATQTIAPSVVQSAGLDALKQQVLSGGLPSNLTNASQGLASTLQNAYNPATAQTLGAEFMQNAPPLAKSGIAETLVAGKDVAPITMQQTPNLATQIQASQLRSAGSAALPADTAAMSGIQPGQNFLQNAANFIQNPSMQAAKDYAEEHPYVSSAAVGLGTKGLMSAMQQPSVKKPEDNALIRPYTYERTQRPEAYAVSPTMDSSERNYFDERFTAGEPYKAAEGGIASAYAVGGQVEQMAALNAVGANTGYPMANLQTPMYSNPAVQRPEATNVIAPSADAGVGAYTGEAKFASGGISDLGGYSDGGRLLKGPGDGVSDSIPASIGGRQPARLADGEFVVPARIVSELGNGSTEAGARKLYAMMERVQKARHKTVGKGKVAVNSKADKHLPA